MSTEQPSSYARALGIVGDALRGSAIGLTPLNQKNQELLADYIMLILQEKTHDEAKSLLVDIEKSPVLQPLNISPERVQKVEKIERNDTVDEVHDDEIEDEDSKPTSEAYANGYADGYKAKAVDWALTEERAFFEQISELDAILAEANSSIGYKVLTSEEIRDVAKKVKAHLSSREWAVLKFAVAPVKNRVQAITALTEIESHP